MKTTMRSYPLPAHFAHRTGRFDELSAAP